MIVGFYQWKDLHAGKTDIYLKVNKNNIGYVEINIIDPYKIFLQKVKVYDQFVSIYNGHSVLALRIENLNFIPELCLGGSVENV